MKEISKRAMLKHMAPGSKWLFSHSRLPERGEQRRTVLKHERGRVIVTGIVKPGEEETVIDGPGVGGPEKFFLTDEGAVVCTLPGVTLTYKPIPDQPSD